MKIALVYMQKGDAASQKAEQLAYEVANWLFQRGHAVFSGLSDEIVKQVDFVICFGGDGTVLHVSNMIVRAVSTIPKEDLIDGKPKVVPLLRVNFGRVGFLAPIRPEKIFEKLEMIFDDDDDNMIIVERNRIEIAVYDRDNNQIAVYDALNDIVMERVDESAVAFEIEIDGETYIVAGDGIIFAPKTGSTAYVENAGGPSLKREDTLILRVVSPSIDSDPYYIRPDTIEFKVKKVHGKVRINVDGPRVLYWEEGYTAIVKKSILKTYFLEVADVRKPWRKKNC